MVHAPQLSRSSHPRLDLIGNEQSSIKGAELTRPGEIFSRRNNPAGLSLYRLQYQTGNLNPNRCAAPEFGLQRVRIAVRHETHVLQPGLKRLPKRRLSHQRKRSQGFTIESPKA